MMMIRKGDGGDDKDDGEEDGGDDGEDDGEDEREEDGCCFEDYKCEFCEER